MVRGQGCAWLAETNRKQRRNFRGWLRAEAEKGEPQPTEAERETQTLLGSSPALA